MINGNSLVVQVGPESTFGTLPTMTHQIRVSSEDFKWTPNKKDEGVLTGGKATGKVQTMSIKVDGSFPCLARPDDVGLFLKHALGVEGAVTPTGTTGYKHTFTSIGTEETDSLQSIGFLLDRKTDTFGYVGCKINKMSFNAASEDFLKLDIEVQGREEIDNCILNTELLPSPLNPFRFREGSISLAGSKFGKVTSIKFDYNNNLDGTIQTADSGKYFEEPEVGAREITTEIEALYSTETEVFRKNYFKTDKLFAVELIFVSEDEIETGLHYVLKITLPNCQCKESGRNVTGAETVRSKINTLAVEEGTADLIKIELTNTRALAY